jgi:hypothetical protein
MLEFSIVTITAFVGAINELVKFLFTTYTNVDIKKYIPIVSICTGLILGIIGYFMPSVQMGSNIIEAIFIGIAAGAAATGVHQVGKQLNKQPFTPPPVVYNNDEEETTDDVVEVEDAVNEEIPQDDENAQ